MSHIHEAQAVTGKIKSVAGAGTATMGNMTLGSMMSESMGSMMKNPGIASGVAVSGAGKSIIRKIFTHPLALFGLGVVAGCYVYKYRKSIISASGEAR